MTAEEVDKLKKEEIELLREENARLHDVLKALLLTAESAYLAWELAMAAEELYDALDEAEKLVSRHGGGLTKPWEQWLAKARKALAKAKGGAE